MLTRDLNNNEKLYLHRRRRGETQSVYCEAMNFSYSTYSAIELGHRPFHDDMPIPSLGKITCNEQCIIQRRRSGLDQWQVAKAIGCSRNWVCLMEKGIEDCGKLWRHWFE